MIDLAKEQRSTMIQEIYQDDPWKMMICCIMLNCTSRDQVDSIRFKFFDKYPDAVSASNADISEMESIIQSLGLKSRRTNTIIRFSKEWQIGDWIEPIELYGIGKYGQDSWEIFQKDNFNVSPNDGALNSYLKRIKKS